DETADFADFGLRHFCERFTVAAHREKQNYKILHAAAEDGAGNDPQRSWQVAKLRCEHRTYERAWSRDRREMVSEDNPLVGRDKVASVVEAFGWSGAKWINYKKFCGDESAVKAISDSIGRDGGDHQPHGIDLLAAMQCDGGESESAEQADENPDKNTDGLG